ncbi:MAG: phosphoenolpyruvate--protein phosphotransferase [Spirochaetales bacterium]|nr:phosphoenolpyruvate--protein phosphotransferase [Spirochaetales bacterium]
MREFTGISASPGIIIGKAFLYLDENLRIPRYSISPDEIGREMDRFERALKKAIGEIEALKKKTYSDLTEQDSQFLDSHILMLQDPSFIEEVRLSLMERSQNVEWIFFKTIQRQIAMLDNADDQYLRERTIDLHDISNRVLNHLLYRNRISLADLTEEVILVTHNLLPSDALAMNKRMIKGIAMDAGGRTSHTAILARSFEIPAVLGLSEITKIVRTGDEIVVDGNSGTVIVNPDEKVRERSDRAWQAWQKREEALLNLNELPAETLDGKHILLKANIEVPEETDSVLSHGADGIGLYRSEFLFLHPGGVATEDEQYRAYRQVLESMSGKPVTIRTLDVGGDKVIPDIEAVEDKNPLLGWRAIRYCLARTDVFKVQLRALLRASVYGDLRIMFPMISGIEELNRALEVLEEVIDELHKQGIPFSNEIPVGIMIEVPSAALTADILAKRADFFSIGTNDLIQYTIAIDRGNEKIAYMYEPFHPGVLRLIKMVIDNAHAHSIPVGMCGEMAADPYATVILLALGLDEFSMSAFGIPEVKQILRSVSLAEAEEQLGTIMEMKSYVDIDKYVKGWMNEHFDILS